MVSAPFFSLCYGNRLFIFQNFSSLNHVFAYQSVPYSHSVIRHSLFEFWINKLSSSEIRVKIGSAVPEIILDIPTNKQSLLCIGIFRDPLLLLSPTALKSITFLYIILHRIKVDGLLSLISNSS